MSNRAFRNVALAFISFVILQGLLSFNLPQAVSAANYGDAHLLDQPIGSNAASPFGLNVGAASRYGIAGQLQIPLNAAAGTGAAWDREEIRWDMVAKGSGWDWGFTDEAVNKANQLGLNVLVLLDYNRDGSHTMPDLNAWAGYVQAVTAHLKGRVHYYEIWNEPDNSVYLAGRNPQDYANLLTTSYNTIKAVDASDQVVTAGVDGEAEPWLEQVMRDGGENHFDIIGVHPYVNPPFGSSASPESKYWIDDRLSYWTAFAARHGNKPLWATEFGWDTLNPQVSETAQADYIARGFVEGIGAGFQKLFVYNFRDQTDQAYGIVRGDWTTPKPAYNVYKNLVSQLSGASFQQRIDLYSSTATSIDNFEDGVNWWTYVNNVTANTAISGQQVHSGGAALQLNYQFQPGSGYAEFGPKSSNGSQLQVSLPGQPTKVGFWIYGDNYGASYNILLTDATGQTLIYHIGRSGTAGWHKLEAFLPGDHTATSGDMTLHYPLKFKSVQTVRQPDPLEPTFGGTVYLDDFYAESGPNVQDYRFSRNNQTLDVVWSDGNGGSVSLPTLSSTATIIDRNGQTSRLNASNGALNFNVGNEMLFVVHQAPTNSNPNPNPPALTGACSTSSSNVQPTSNFTQTAFNNLWNRYDLYAPGNRSFVWGNKPFAAGTEPYAQSPSGMRQVLYFDKSRMEITQPGANSSAAGYVTNGLLTVELITGKVQTGDNQADPNQYRQCAPAQIPVAGDLDDTSGPKYASLAARMKDGPTAVGGSITRTIGSDGSISNNTALSSYGVVGGYYVAQTNHTIAKPFWDFLNNANQRIWVNGSQVTGKLFDPWYVAPGLPITEAYWAKVKVGGQVKDVLIQAFERRVLTYTPSNPPAFQVEWGNIGRHYYQWRYGVNPS